MASAIHRAGRPPTNVRVSTALGLTQTLLITNHQIAPCVPALTDAGGLILRRRQRQRTVTLNVQALETAIVGLEYAYAPAVMKERRATYRHAKMDALVTGGA